MTTKTSIARASTQHTVVEIYDDGSVEVSQHETRHFDSTEAARRELSQYLLSDDSRTRYAGQQGREEEELWWDTLARDGLACLERAGRGAAL